MWYKKGKDTYNAVFLMASLRIGTLKESQNRSSFIKSAETTY
jgi:hypothetical protein